MRKLSFLIIGFLAASVVGGFLYGAIIPTAASSSNAVAAEVAQDNSTLKILIVSLEDVIKQSKVGNSLRDQLESQTKDIQKKVAAQNSKVDAEAKTLNDKRSKMSDEEYNKMLDKLTQKRDEGLKNIREVSEGLRAKLEVAQGKIDDVLRKDIFPKMLKQEGGSIIIPKGYIIAVNSDSKLIEDITPQVISQLNKELPDIRLESISVGKGGSK